MAELERGKNKVAVLILSLPKESAAKLFNRLEDSEIEAISKAMLNIGSVPPNVTDSVLAEFYESFLKGSAVVGGFKSAERLLKDILQEDKAKTILGSIQGRALSIWERLANVREDVLMNFVKNENPQVAAIILNRMKTDFSARIFSKLPDDVAISIMTRMLDADSVPREVVAKIESALEEQFMGDKDVKKISSVDVLAHIFNAFDKDTETRLMDELSTKVPESADRIKAIMFTFDDMIALDSGAIQQILREADKNILSIALKGANEALRKQFLSNMSERAGKMLTDNIAELGMMRVKDVYEAQGKIVKLAKTLADSGVINLPDKSGGGEYI